MKEIAVVGLKLVIMAVVLILMINLAIASADALYIALNGEPKPELGRALVFPEGWQPVMRGDYQRYTCERDGVYRECQPLLVEVTDTP